MQFSTILLVSGLVASVTASPVAVTNDSGLVRRDASSDAVAVLNAAEPALLKDYAALNKLTPKSNQADIEAAVTQLNNDLKPLVSKLQSLTADAKAAQGIKRATDLELAVTRLITELNTELPRIFTLVHHLTNDLGLSSVTDIVRALEPTLYSLIAAAEALLASLTPGLSTLVDPLLTGVVNLLAGLGLNLDGDLAQKLGLEGLIDQLGLDKFFNGLAQQL